METAGCKKWLETLGLGEYAPKFTNHAIDFDVLPLLDHEDLRELGIESLGHRLIILRACEKLGRVSNEPLSLQRRLESLESELKATKEAHARLRSDILPLFRMFKENEPLPTPVAKGNSPTDNYFTGAPVYRSFQGQSPATHVSLDEKPFKRFALHKNKPCSDVIPMVLQKYGLEGDPSNFRMQINWGEGHSRTLENNEKVLQVYKELIEQGEKPVLRIVPAAGYESQFGQFSI